MSAEKEFQPSKPPEIETENIFDPELDRMPANPEFLSEMEAMIDNPMVNIVKTLLTQYFNAIMPKMPEPIKSEHKVRIFRLNDKTIKAKVAAEIEGLLNDGYCCHMPTVCNDFLIMDFSRTKEGD